MTASLPIDDSAKRMSRALDSLTRALDNASSNAIDGATESIAGLIKSSKLFNDEMVGAIKDVKSLESALGKLGDEAKEYKRLQARLNNGTLSATHVMQELVKRGIKPASDGILDLNKSLDDLHNSVDNLSEELVKATKPLTTAGAQFGKVLDEGRSKVAGFAAKTLTATFALGKLKEGAELIYKSGVKLANKGLLSSMGQLTTSALMLRMGTEEFIELVDKNRDTVMALGGGAKGIEAFEDNIRKSSDGLAYMGKDGKKAVATWMGSFIRSGGTIDEYVRSSKGLNSQFETLQKTVGTTVEEFAEYIEEINNSQMIQAKLNLGDKAAARQLRQEAMARTDQYAALQLTTKQMVVMNKTLESMYNPNKNNQAEIIKQKEYAKIAIRATSAEMRKAGRTVDADKLDEGFTNGSIDKLLNGGDAAKDPKLMAVARSLDNMRGFNAELRAGDNTSMKNVLGVEMADRSEILKQIQSIGAIGNQADSAKGKNQGQKHDEQKKKALDQGLGTDIFTGLRAGIEAITSITGSLFTPAVTGATIALGLLATSATAAAMAQGAGGMIKRGGAAAGRGLLSAGARVLPALGTVGALAGAGAAGYYGAKGVMNLMGVDPGKLGSGLYDILHPDPNAKKPASPQSASILPRSAGSGGSNSSLLAQIAQGEGTSDTHARAKGFASGYDVTLGYGAFHGKTDKPLSQMTIGEVKKLQAEMLANPKNNMNSSAVGKYQIVGKTMRGLQGQLGFKDTDLFDGPMQDKMAEVLLKQRGLDAYRSGKMGADSFQNNLSKEWASIAHASSGRSFYGQHTGTSTSAIQAAMINKDPLIPTVAPVSAVTTSSAPSLTNDNMIAQHLATIANNTTRRLGDGNHGKQDKRSAMEVA